MLAGSAGEVCLFFAAVFFFSFFFFLAAWHMVSQLPDLQIEPVPLALEVQSLNPWTARDVPAGEGLDRNVRNANQPSLPACGAHCLLF